MIEIVGDRERRKASKINKSNAWVEIMAGEVM